VVPINGPERVARSCCPGENAAPRWRQEGAEMLTFRKHAKELRLLLAIAAGGLAVASMMAGAMSLALFTDQKTVNNSFTAGTIALDGPGIATLSLSSSPLMPGDTKNSSVTVKNNGTAQLRYSVSAASTNTDSKNLRGVLNLTVKDIGTGCANFDGNTLFTGTLGATTSIIGLPAQGADAGDRNLDSTDSEVLCFRLSLPIGTGNAYQGATTTTTFTFDAEQTANN
jgi:predicted ribosomally synthesized peptide with SipW-like signal peptide